MKLGYTEFSFGYAFTENLIRQAAAPPAGAPFFPNLRQEARLGYDVHIDLPTYPLYLQFKLPDLMTRNSAAEISQFSLLGIHVPFFPVSLPKRNVSSQHASLVRLEHAFPDSVFYASPAMTNMRSFNIAYRRGMVHFRSVMFSPADIGLLPDSKQHFISYTPEFGVAWLRSEPREIRTLQFQFIQEKVQHSFEDPIFSTLEVAVRSIREALRPLVSAQIWEADGAIRQRIRTARTAFPDPLDRDEVGYQTLEDLLLLREIARVGLGLELVVAQPAS